MMNRLTTDNPQSNFETMMNFAYAKDRRVVLRFGLGQEDIDLCDYIVKASQNNCNLTPEEVMEGACLECDNGYCTLGIFYAVATQAAELRTRLKEYEDKEENHGLFAWDIIERLARAFPQSTISNRGEFIAHRTGECFNLQNCRTELDVKCKVLEYFSRAAFKTEPYKSVIKNAEFHAYMLDGINIFLGTRFTENDMEYIYTYLGNAIKHEKTIEFITKANFNMGFFNQFS